MLPGELIFAGSGAAGTIEYSQKSTGCKWTNTLDIARLVIALNSSLESVVSVALRAEMDEKRVYGNCPQLGRQALNFELGSKTISGDQVTVLFVGTNSRIPLSVVISGTLSGNEILATATFRRTGGAPRWLNRLHQSLALQALTVQPSILEFPNVGSSYAQNATVYSPNGPITIEPTSSSCLAITPNGASISPSSVESGASFSIIPLAAGACTFIMTDAASRAAALTVSVSVTTIGGN